MKDEVIVKIGAEGGSVTLLGSRSAEGWRFRMKTADQSGEFLNAEDREGPPLYGRTQLHHASDSVESWQAAIALLDKYPWHRLYPLVVHPEFAEPVMEAVRSKFASDQGRGRSPDEYELSRWAEVCDGGSSRARR